MEVKLGQLAVRTAAMAVGFAATLFLPAGTLDWPAAWIFLGLFFGFSGVLSLWLLRFNPDLLAERLTGIGKPDQKAWDKIWLAITAVAFFAWLVLMALDAVRFPWSHMPLWLQGLGGALLLSSFYLFFLTFRTNPYLSPAVRLQRERAQKVVNTGPYHYVRHPMYAGFLLFAPAQHSCSVPGMGCSDRCSWLDWWRGGPCWRSECCEMD